MAECFDEFDDATPLRNTFCTRLSLQEYEDQTANTTEEAIAQLMAHLDCNPQEYRKVLQAKKRDEANIFSYIKVKLFSFFSLTDELDNITDEECSEKLEKMKENMIKSYNYSQESRGRRFSKRLIDRRVQKEVEKVATPIRGNVPLPPPLPPSFKTGARKLRSNCATPIVHATLTRRPLSTKPVIRNKPCASGDIISQLKGSQCKRKLKTVGAKSPGGTPVECGPKRRQDSEMLPYFNAKLLNKFKNVHSPSFTMASPGSFESPTQHTPTQHTPSTLPPSFKERDVDTSLTIVSSGKENLNPV